MTRSTCPAYRKGVLKKESTDVTFEYKGKTVIILTISLTGAMLVYRLWHRVNKQIAA
jgi:hypothetical protein